MHPTGAPTARTGPSLARSRPARAAPPDPPRVDWAEMGPELIAAWGRPRGKAMPEHFSIYGQTGSGKSYFQRWLLTERARARGSHVVIIATKPADDTLTGMGWPIIKKWPPGYGKNQVIYWAKQPGKPGNPEGLIAQRLAVQRLLDELWVEESNIIVAFDEVAYVCEELRLARVVARHYREGRGLGISIVGTTQRPSGVVRQMHSEAAWKVCFAPEDEDDAKRMAQVLGNRHWLDVLYSLDREKFEFLVIRQLTKEAYISHIPPQKRRRPADR